MITTRPTHKKNTVRAYKMVLDRFYEDFADEELDSLTSDQILVFLNKLTEGNKQNTRSIRYSSLSAFFNFVKINIDPDLQNPCDTPILRKMFKVKPITSWDIIDKEVVDEIIFRTDKLRDRIIMELMARGGMRVGEVLKLRPMDVHERKLTLRDPKSGKERENVFIPQKVADRLAAYVRDNDVQLDQRIFPICYEAVRKMVKKAGNVVGIHLRPHDLRRHAATYASRSGVPIEIVSKVILRHANLSTTQIYLGKVSDNEAMRWIENLYA